MALHSIAIAALALASVPSAAQAPVGSALEVFVQGAKRVMGETVPAEAVAREPTPRSTPFHVPLSRTVSDAPVDVQSEDGLISLSVRDASLRQVLAALAESQGLNLIVASPADAPVTAEFKRMPLREVFETILRSTGHSWTEQGGAIVITSLATGGALSPEVQGRRVAVLELDFASAADLQPAVEGLLSSVGQSHFVEIDPSDNRRTKELLIVEDIDPYLARIEQYVSQADQPPRQVLIEVNLLEIDLDDSERRGVNFRAISQISGTELAMGAVGLADVGATTTSFITTEGGDLESFVEAIISTTDAKSIAAPRLMAVNGQESQIQIGERLGYRVTTTTQTSSLESVNFLEVGVVLTITPRITRDGRVLLRVSPKVSSGAINPETGVPDEETTELHTDALLNSGQGMVIGGLIQERDIIQVSRIPVLGSLPYVNPLFQRRSTEKRRSELIVALVPHVLPFSPEDECVNHQQAVRAREPLFNGPLCRNPRPYEPRLYDPYVDERRCHLLDRHDPFCNPWQTATAHTKPGGLRRLPEVECPCVDETPEVANRHDPSIVR